MNNAALAIPLVLTGLLGVSLAQQETPQVEQGSAPTDELPHLLHLLALQEQQLDLIQEQIRLTKQRILSISDPGVALAMIEVEVKFIEVLTNEPGEFERLLGLPDSGDAFNLVLDATNFQGLLARAESIEGASVVSRPKVAFRDGGAAQITNITDVPFYGPDGEVKTAQIGFEGRFGATVMPENAIALSMDVEVKRLVGQMKVTAPDGTERVIPTIAGRSATAQATVQMDEGVVQGWLQVHEGQAFTHVLCFVRPRILGPGEFDSPFGERDF